MGGLSPHFTDGEQAQTGKPLGQGGGSGRGGMRNRVCRPPATEPGAPGRAEFLRIKPAPRTQRRGTFGPSCFPSVSSGRAGSLGGGGWEGATTSCSGRRGPHEVVIRGRPLPGLGRLPLSEPGRGRAAQRGAPCVLRPGRRLASFHFPRSPRPSPQPPTVGSCAGRPCPVPCPRLCVCAGPSGVLPRRVCREAISLPLSLREGVGDPRSHRE